jgi:hypothetical protein
MENGFSEFSFLIQERENEQEGCSYPSARFQVAINPLLSAFCVCGVLFRAMDGSSWMLGWCIERGQLQRTMPGVSYVVPRTGRHQNSFIISQSALHIQSIPAISHSDNGLPLLNTNELIRFRMHFQSDLTICRSVHKGHM